MASQFQVSHFEDYRHIGSRKWKESFRNNLLFSITPFDKLQEPNWDSIVHNVKIDFTKTYLGAIVPTESRNPFEEIEENKEGSQAIFENWQILVGLRSYTVWGGVRLLQKTVYWILLDSDRMSFGGETSFKLVSNTYFEGSDVYKQV